MKEMNTITENESSKRFQGLYEQYNKCIIFLMELLGGMCLTYLPVHPCCYYILVSLLSCFSVRSVTFQKPYTFILFHFPYNKIHYMLKLASETWIAQL